MWIILQHNCILIKTLISWPKLPSDNWTSDGIFVWRDFCFVFFARARLDVIRRFLGSEW